MVIASQLRTVLSHPLEIYLGKARLTTPAQPLYSHLNQPLCLS